MQNLKCCSCMMFRSTPCMHFVPRGSFFGKRFLPAYICVRNRSSRLFTDDATVGYGPFSSTVKPSPTSEEQGKVGTKEGKRYLELNRQLRQSLARVKDPSSLSSIPFRSFEWSTTMIQLYRTIMRLHNKPIALSLSTSLKGNRQKAIKDVSGFVSKDNGVGGASFLSSENRFSSSSSDLPSSDVFIRYLLTDDQRLFGNSFLKMQFEAHMDADLVTATNFYASWYDYILHLASGITEKEMTDAEKKLFTDDQMSKLEVLKSGFISFRSSSRDLF